MPRKVMDLVSNSGTRVVDQVVLPRRRVDGDVSNNVQVERYCGVA